MYGLIVGVAVWATWPTQAQERTVGKEVTPITEGDSPNQAAATEPGAPFPEVFPLAPGTVFRRVVIGEDPEDVTAGPSTKPIYTNERGSFVVAPGAGFRFADDLALAARFGGTPSCRIRSVEFPVVGKVDPTGVGGPFSVDFALYRSCPGLATTTAILNSQEFLIAGTSGRAAFPTEDPAMVVFSFGTNGVAIPAGVTSVWLAVTFNRGNAGIVAGSPAQQGFSCDIYDFPGFECASNFGGFPLHPFGAMNVRLFGNNDCGDGHIGYRANQPKGPTYNPGPNVWLTDDIQLGVSSCQMIAYEIAAQGTSAYTTEIRNVCDSAPIAGTTRIAAIQPGVSEVRLLRQIFDPPITLPPEFEFAVQVSQETGKVVIAGQRPCVGSTEDLFQLQGETGCNDFEFPNVHDAIHLTIFCAGAPPIGACCDMFFTNEQGESVCREVPRMNCPFPPVGSVQRPGWMEGAACSPDPFVPGPCGASACCKPDDTCENMTQAACNNVPPLERARQWQRGLFCSIDAQECPFNACLARSGECVLPRNCPFPLCPQTCREQGINCPPGCEECPPIGCEDPICCTTVCRRDFFCCDTEWDAACASIAEQFCTSPPENDECAPTDKRGATVLTIPGTDQTLVTRATTNTSDFGYGCYVNDPLNQGNQSIWYKFVAPAPIAPNTRSNVVLSTCNSDSPADDALLQVFAAGNQTDAATQCQSLIPRGCVDDLTSCGRNGQGRNARICARDLIPGNTYYAMLAAKEAETSTTAKYRIDTSQVANCPTGIGHQLDDTNDFCDRAITITGPETPFDLGRATPPYTPDWAEPCIPEMDRDLWFNYTATCTGKLTVETCGPSAQLSPDTTLAVYDGATCPIRGLSAALACNSDAGAEAPAECGVASYVTVDVIVDQPLKIRVGNSVGNGPAGNLGVSCAQSTCPTGFITLVQPPAEGGIPEGVLDAQRPHAPDNASTLEGIQTLKVATTRDAQASCFSLCESAQPPAPNATPNAVQSVVQNPPGIYTITLARPITPGAKTKIIYTPSDPNVDLSGVYLYSHPGNVNDDNTVNQMDVLSMRDALNSAFVLPWGLYSGDVNRSFVNNPGKSSGITPADMLEVIDLVNGAGQYPTFGLTATPKNSPACP